MTNSSQGRFLAATKGALHLSAVLRFYRGSLRAEVADGVQNFLAVHFDSFFAKAGDTTEFLEIRGLREAQVHESGILHDYISGYSLFLCSIAPPLAQILFQLHFRRAQSSSRNTKSCA